MSPEREAQIRAKIEALDKRMAEIDASWGDWQRIC